MTVKPSYEELERRVQELEIIESEYKYLLEVTQENEGLFKRLYEKAPLGYQSLDENGHFLVVNPTWLDTLGYAKEEVIGKSFAEFLHPDWIEHFTENFPRFKSIGEVLGVEFEMVKRNGDLILVSFTGKISRDKQGAFQQTHCIFHDITERKQAEEALRESEERYREIVNLAVDGILQGSADGKIIGANSQMQEWLGSPLEQLLGLHVSELFDPEELKAKPLRFDLLTLKQPLVNERNLRCSDGTSLPVEMHSKRMPDGTYQSIYRDITERKKAEELQQALYDISEKAHLATSGEGLYKSLHTIVARLLNAKNFIIALRQERGGVQYLKMVYMGDEFDAHMQGMELKIDPNAKLSFSGYLLKTGKPMLLSYNTYDEFCLVNDIHPIGTKPQSLIGVPFYLEHLAGVVLVPSYHQVIFTDKDKDLLVYVARHIGDALNRKKLLDDMREANEIFSLFLRHSPMHVYIKEVKNGESRIVQASEAYGKFLNKTAAEIIDKNMTELFPAEFAAKTTANDWRVVSSNIPLQTEDHLAGRIYSTIKFPIIQGGKSLLAGFSVDITERKQAEEERLNLERQLQQAQKAESLSRMAGSHCPSLQQSTGSGNGELGDGS